MNENDDAPATFCLSGVHYIEFLNALHNHVTPRSYLEVGTATGASLSVAGCDTIAVDPQFAVGAGATGNRTRTLFFQMTSDDFFATCWTVRLPAWSRSPGWILNRAFLPIVITRSSISTPDPFSTRAG
jgi:hypothetical protein